MTFAGQRIVGSDHIDCVEIVARRSCVIVRLIAELPNGQGPSHSAQRLLV